MGNSAYALAAGALSSPRPPHSAPPWSRGAAKAPQQRGPSPRSGRDVHQPAAEGYCDHHDAEDVLVDVEHGGPQAAKALRRLLNLKDAAHYGLGGMSKADLTTALRQATKLIELTAEALRR